MRAWFRWVAAAAVLGTWGAQARTGARTSKAKQDSAVTAPEGARSTSRTHKDKAAERASSSDKWSAEKPSDRSSETGSEAPRPHAQAPLPEGKEPVARYSLDLDSATRLRLADRKRDEAIAQLQELIPKFDDSNPDKPDLYFQLSEYYWEKFKYLYALEEQRHENAYRAFDRAGGKGEPPKVDHSQSEAYRQKTIALYEQILANYRDYDRTDEVLFSLAFNLQETATANAANGKLSRELSRKAVARYEELVKRYPKSRFVPDAWVQLGDYWFNHNELDKSEPYYVKADQAENPRVRTYAHYKLAWCDFNRERFDAGLQKLHQVVEAADAQGSKMRDLRNEALSDTVLFYVKLDRPDDAIHYFESKASPARQPKLIAHLAQELADAGLHEHAIHAFHYAIEKDPMRPEAPDFQQQIVREYKVTGQREKVRAEVRKLADLYRPGGVWWTHNAKDEGVLRSAFDVSEEAMRTVVTEYHQEAQLTKQVETYKLARDIYKQYLDAFASSKDPKFISDYAFNLRFYYAEILWTLEDWPHAAEQYDLVVAAKIPDRDTARQITHEEYRKTAAYDAILAWDKLLKIERGELDQSNLKDGQKVDEDKGKGRVEKGGKIVKRSAKELEEKPLTTVEQKLMAACDAYVQRFPGEKDEVDIRYQSALIAYDKNHFVEAAKRFGDIILKFPEEKRSQQAADLTMYILDAKQEWAELNKLSREFLANKKLCKAGTGFTRRVANIVEGSQYKYIDEVVYKKDHDPKKAGAEFLKFVEEFPKAKTADRALTYAMLMFQESNQVEKAISIGERELKEYPGSPLEPKVRYSLAHLYEQIADFPKSASMFEAFIQSYDRHVKALPEERQKLAEANKKRAQSRKGTSDDEDSELDPLKLRAERLDEETKLLDEAKAWLADAQFDAALWYEGLGQNDRAIASYRQYMARFKDRKDVPEIAFNVGLIQEKAGRHLEAMRTFEDFATRFGHDGRATPQQHFLARYHAFTQALEAHNKGEADRLQNDLVHGYGRLPVATRKDVDVLNAYAHARFLALEPLWNQYTDIQLKRVNALRQDLVTKKRKLAEVEKAYVDVLGIGSGEWGIASLIRVGMAYDDFARNITDSPTPRGLNDDQKQMYRAELEKLSQPLEDKSLETLEKGLAKAYELSIYNDWTLKAQDAVNKYRPGAYAAVRQVQYEGSDAFMTSPLVDEKGEPVQARADATPAPAPASPNGEPVKDGKPSPASAPAGAPEKRSDESNSAPAPTASAEQADAR